MLVLQHQQTGYLCVELGFGRLLAVAVCLANGEQQGHLYHAVLPYPGLVPEGVALHATANSLAGRGCTAKPAGIGTLLEPGLGRLNFGTKTSLAVVCILILLAG